VPVAGLSIVPPREPVKEPNGPDNDKNAGKEEKRVDHGLSLHDSQNEDQYARPGGDSRDDDWPRNRRLAECEPDDHGAAYDIRHVRHLVNEYRSLSWRQSYHRPHV